MKRIRILVTGLISAAIFSTILFIAAGRIAYMQGWLFLSTNIVTTLIHFLAFPKNNDLLEERSTVKEGAKSWDKLLLGISAIIYFITIVVAGLDSGRFHWSPYCNVWVNAVGVLLAIAGQLIFLTALRENRFFSSIVRIQKEKGHTVCDTGIYRIIRHPGYSGMTLSLAGVPFITGSVWSAIPTSVAIIILFVRTVLEDNTLKNELDGYIEYTRKTRFKLIPFIW